MFTKRILTINTAHSHISNARFICIILKPVHVVELPLVGIQKSLLSLFILVLVSTIQLLFPRSVTNAPCVRALTAAIIVDCDTTCNWRRLKCESVRPFGMDDEQSDGASS